MDKHIIVGVHVLNRESRAEDVQHLFTKYGEQIKTRLGLHDVHDGFSSANGLILLEMLDTEQTNQMIDELKSINGVDVNIMIFDH
jgi:hypothetical protein